MTGLEDVDWARRVQEAGFEIAYSAEAEIVHVHDETLRGIHDRYRREAIAHKQIFPEQSFTPIAFLWLLISHSLSDYRTAFGERVLLEHLFEIPKFRSMQFFGTYRGFNRESPISERSWQRFYYPDRRNYPERNDPEGVRESVNEIDYGDHERVPESSSDST